MSSASAASARGWVSRPSGSKAFAASATSTSGPGTIWGRKGTRQSRSEDCALSPPDRPAVADMIATGLSRQTGVLTRLTQSSAFLSTPEIALLYSGVTTTTASAEAIASASRCTASGMPCASMSPS